MDNLDDGESQLTIISPPYIGHHSAKKKENEAALLRGLLRECSRVTATDGIVASYNTDFRDKGAIYPRHIVVLDAAKASGLELIAEKIRVRTLRRDMYRLGFSFIFIFRKKGSKVRRNNKIPEYERDVWVLPKSQIVGKFRDAIPPEVPAILIKNFTIEGDLVVSSCAGSGTIVIAALGMNRRSVGYEIDDARIQVIKERERRFETFFSDAAIAQWCQPLK